MLGHRDYDGRPQVGDTGLITRELEKGSIKMFDPEQPREQWIASTHSVEDLNIDNY